MTTACNIDAVLRREVAVQPIWFFDEIVASLQFLVDKFERIGPLDSYLIANTQLEMAETCTGLLRSGKNHIVDLDYLEE
jgi:hypothetical protein